jgi:hypothetical protein
MLTRVVNHAHRVILQIMSSHTDDHRGIIYNHNTSIVPANEIFSCSMCHKSGSSEEKGFDLTFTLSLPSLTLEFSRERKLLFSVQHFLT